MPEAERTDGLWQQAKILRGRTEAAKQLPAKQMLQVEQLGDDALPSTTELATVLVRGASKYAQLGEDAMQKVLDAVMEGPDWGKHHGSMVLVLVEVNPGVANLWDAFMSRKAGLRMPMHYVALADSEIHRDWLKHTKGMVLKEKHAMGELQVARHPQPTPEMPTDLLESKPPAPVLNRLTIVEGTAGSAPQLSVPKDLVATWSQHERFHTEFDELL